MKKRVGFIYILFISLAMVILSFNVLKGPEEIVRSVIEHVRDQDTTSLTVKRDQLEKVWEMVSYFEGNHAGTYELHVKDRGKSIDNRTQVTAQWESIIYERDNRVRAVSDATLLFILERVSWREWNITEVEILSPMQEK